jgi:hypothetical protein
MVDGWRGSLVVLFDKSHVLAEGYASRVVGVDLVKVPLDHLFGDGDVEGLESVLHQLSELLDIDQIVLFSLLGLRLGLLGSISEEVGELL